MNYQSLCDDINKAKTKTNCRIFTFKADIITVQSLAKLLDLDDYTNKDVNAITFVDITTTQSISIFSYELDSFLLSRPWWHLLAQPFQFSNSNKEEQSIILQRIPSFVEPFSKYISDLYFPTNKDACKDRPAYVTLVDSTWGHGLLNMDGSYSRHSRQMLFLPYTTKTNNYHDICFLADGIACPKIMNKWECIFLNVTTCSLPKLITDCRSKSCLPFDRNDQPFLSTTPDAYQLNSSNNNEYQKKKNSLPDFNVNNYQKEVQESNYMVSKDKFGFIYKDVTHIIKESNRFVKVDNSFFIFGL
jgi:hypothetical protein